jgi:hypothetical protein
MMKILPPMKEYCCFTKTLGQSLSLSHSLAPHNPRASQVESNAISLSSLHHHHHHHQISRWDNKMPSLPHGADQLVVGPDAFMVTCQIPSFLLSHSGFLLIGRDRIEEFRRGFH